MIVAAHADEMRFFVFFAPATADAFREAASDSVPDTDPLPIAPKAERALV